MFNEYPYTDLHNLNLDWFLDQFKKIGKHLEDLKKMVLSAPDATNANAGQSPIADGQGGWQWGRPTAVNVPVNGFYNNETEELVFENVNGTELFGIDVSELGGSDVTIDPTLTQSGQAADAKVVGSKVDWLKNAINYIDSRFDDPNVMDYTSLQYNNRFVNTDGQIRPQGSATNSIIFAVEPNTSYYLKVVGGYNRRSLAGSNTSEFLTGTTYTQINSTADGTTGIIFTTPANVSYVFVYFYNGTPYEYNSDNFILYKGLAIPEITEPYIKKTNLPPDTLFTDSEAFEDVKEILYRVSVLDNDFYYPSETQQNIYGKYGKFRDGGTLRVDYIPNDIYFAIRAYTSPAYATIAWQSSTWLSNVPYEIQINKDWYYLVAFRKNMSVPFTDFNELNGFTLKHITTVQNEINNATPLTSQTVKTIAHRGDITIAPQNTAPSYILARKEGHTIAENDVWVSADGEYVMEHDTSLSRLGDMVDINGYEMYTDGSTFYYYDTDNSQLYIYTTDYVASSIDVATLTRCNGTNYAVTGLALAVLKRIDFGVYKGSQFKGTQILTFAEWILLMKRLGMDAYIDRKIGYTPTIATQLANIVKSYGMLDHVSWIGVPTAQLIEAIRSVDPNARIGVLEHPTTENVVTYAPYNTGRGFFFNGNAKDGLTESAVQIGINAGFEVESYYVGYETPVFTESEIFATIKNAISYGITGITLDHYRVDDAINPMLDEYHIR